MGVAAARKHAGDHKAGGHKKASRTTKPAPATRSKHKAVTAHAAESAAASPEEQAPDSATRTITLTVPLNRDLATAAAHAATMPLAAAKAVAQDRNGLPAYLAISGLAVVGAIEWPVAAAAGVGLAAMRRWGPLKPETAEQESSAGEPAGNQ